MSTDYKILREPPLMLADLKVLQQGPDSVWLTGKTNGRRWGDLAFQLTDGENYLWGKTTTGGVVEFFWRAGYNRPHDIIAFLMVRFGLRLVDDQGFAVSLGYE